MSFIPWNFFSTHKIQINLGYMILSYQDIAHLDILIHKYKTSYNKISFTSSYLIYFPLLTPWYWVCTFPLLNVL